MKAPVKWLRDYVDITLPAKELARRLTMAGMEVKAVETIGGKWDKVFVGRIAAVNAHPNADRLRLVTVDLGIAQETVVCGAPNLTVEDKIAFARVGAELQDGHTGEMVKLKPAKIRGVLSAGMVCSEKELGISQNHEGILVLPPEATPGTPLVDVLGDTILDLDVTPNRADCLSVIGIARELGALTGQKLYIPEISYLEAGGPIEGQITVEIVDPALCPRYCASLITGVNIGPSPKWMQDRLVAGGMRPINNVVDITNYVMLEYGQPLHSFDYERLRGQKIIVRRARPEEFILTLDGNERRLADDTLVISDAERAVAIAGVMGGANSEVVDSTTAILLESANFNAVSIHYTSRKLGLVSEASIRFERGIRPGLAEPALKRATQFIVELAGGKAAVGIADAYPGKKEREPITLSVDAPRRLLGMKYTQDEIMSTLAALGFDCRAVSESEVVAAVPYWRNDIQGAVDLVEEVARITGYERIPMTMLSTTLPPHDPAPIVGLKRRLCDYLVGYGFQEMITYSLTSLDLLDRVMPERAFKPMRLANPMTADQEYLRPDLRANLLDMLRQNRRHEEGGLRLFELGKVFRPRPNDLPEEPEMLCGLLNGMRSEKSWLTADEPFDFFDAKGVVQALLGKLGTEAAFEAGDDPALHPARQAAVLAGEKRIGAVGELHPRVAHAFELTQPVYLFELNIDAMAPFATPIRMYQPVPRFPSTARDIALVIDAKLRHKSIEDIIRGFSLVTEVALFDVYSGEQVPAGKRSLAYRITYQAPDHTLTDEEVNQVHGQILDRLAAQVGATLRS